MSNLSAVSADVMKMFTEMNQQASEAEPNQGMGSLGWWPESGDHECIIEDLTIGKGEFVYGRRPNRISIPAVEVQFVYRLYEDPTSPDGNPRSFRGKPFYLLSDAAYGKLPEGGDHGKQKTRYRMDRDRFAGHLTAILNEQPGNFMAAIETVRKNLEEATAANSAIMVEVKVEWGTDQNNNPRPEREFIKRTIATTS